MSSVVFTLVSSATDLSGLQLLEIFGARFRQEDGFRDLKQRLGWEECRAWTRQPILRTTQAQLLALTLLRLLQFRLEAAAGDGWWLHPPWNKRKRRPSVLDLPETLPRVSADAALLERAVANVVDNARVWSPEEQCVRVEAGAVGKRVDLRVIDHGPGIPVDQRELVHGIVRAAGQRRFAADDIAWHVKIRLGHDGLLYQLVLRSHAVS